MIDVAVSEGVVYYVRVLPATTTYTDTGTITWSSSTRGYPLEVSAVGAEDTPSWMSVSVSNGVPLAPVEFDVDGGPILFDTTLDEAGQVVNTTIPLPSLTAGDHVLTASTPDQSGTAVFTVINPPIAYPDAPGTDSDAAAVTQTGVVKWVIQVPGVSNYIFEINPAKMSSPHSARVITSEHSTAPDGQPLTFEGSPIGVDWTIEGTVRTQGFHDALDTALAYQGRVYLIDHLSRAWTVTFESIGWTRLPEAYNDWAFTYQLKAIIYAGPRNLS